MSVSTLRGRLEEGDSFSSLYDALETKWKVPLPSSSDGSRRNRTGYDIGVGATADSGTGILEFLANLLSRRSAGLDRLVLAVVSGAGGVDLVHSLFLVNGSEYEEDLPEVWGIVGEIPAEGLPAITRLTSMIFANNTTFTGTSSSEFESHVTSLSSVEPRDFDSCAHQPADDEDEGSRPIPSRGAAFIPAAAALAILDLGDGASIAEVVSRAYPIVSSSDTTSFDAAANWLQASFTSRDDGSFVSGPIRTRRSLPVVALSEGTFRHDITMAHLQRSFPGHYLPPEPHSEPILPIDPDELFTTSTTTKGPDPSSTPHPHVSWKSAAASSVQLIPGRGDPLRIRGGSVTSPTASLTPTPTNLITGGSASSAPSGSPSGSAPASTVGRYPEGVAG